VHLREADDLADLALGHVPHEAELENPTLLARQLAPSGGEGLALGDGGVAVVAAPDDIQQRRAVVAVGRGGGVERDGLVAAGRLVRLQQLLGAAADGRGHLTNAGRAAKLLRQPLALARGLQRALLQVARDVKRPALVAEVALQLAEDRRRGVAGKAGTTARLVAVDRLQEPDVGDLDQILDRLVRVRVAQRQVAGEREEPLDQLPPSGQVARPGVADEELLFGAAGTRGSDAHC